MKDPLAIALEALDRRLRSLEDLRPDLVLRRLTALERGQVGNLAMHETLNELNETTQAILRGLDSRLSALEHGDAGPGEDDVWQMVLDPRTRPVDPTDTGA